MLSSQATLELAGINKISAKLCLQDYFYSFTCLEEVLGIGVSTAKILKSRIMKAFLQEELIYDLRAFFSKDYEVDSDEKPLDLSPELFIKFFAIQESEKDKDWDFYEHGILKGRSDDRKEYYKIYVSLIIHNLAIHITDLIAVLRNCGLTTEAEFFSLIEPKKRTKQEIAKLKTEKRNKKIIEQYQIIFKNTPKLSIAGISILIKGQLLLDLGTRTIQDIITDHRQQNVTDTWEKYQRQRNRRIEEIMLGIDYAEANKDENGLLPKINRDPPTNIFKPFFGKDGEISVMYYFDQDFIQNLWEKHQGKPTEEQVSEALDNKAQDKIMSKFCIAPHKLKQMIKKIDISC